MPSFAAASDLLCPGPASTKRMTVSDHYSANFDQCIVLLASCSQDTTLVDHAYITYTARQTILNMCASNMCNVRILCAPNIQDYVHIVCAHHTRAAVQVSCGEPAAAWGDLYLPDMACHGSFTVDMRSTGQATLKQQVTSLVPFTARKLAG